MERKKRNYFFVFVFTSLLLSSMAGGRRKLLNEDEAESMGTLGSMQQLQEDEVAVVIHERILRQVKMNDYGAYDPSPTMAKPHFKDIPN
ncbi:uncharacterized protein LOC133887678 [Phragmites australis]|uniref:uncharacterized protein LOC133887678 n=1 Tax=Phragmites australis TaxID=29695 RepID=UPI002D78E208|nr:uncharacterized protein LOC133887678 [Phragmites australis]